MKIVGIDPGLSSTGIGIVEGMGLEVENFSYGSIDTSKNTPLPGRLDVIYSKLLSLLKTENPDLLIIGHVTDQGQAVHTEFGDLSSRLYCGRGISGSHESGCWRMIAPAPVPRVGKRSTHVSGGWSRSVGCRTHRRATDWQRAESAWKPRRARPR